MVRKQELYVEANPAPTHVPPLYSNMNKDFEQKQLVTGTLGKRNGGILMSTFIKN